MRWRYIQALVKVQLFGVSLLAILGYRDTRPSRRFAILGSALISNVLFESWPAYIDPKLKEDEPNEND
ncbi:hypothetical protein [Desulfosporosinus sp. Sb-LF]|uniref:hypothetical protein n=1 Tax=Desulfosporosinus sp. Sb-LF TaxID=2560027 RepID=UPI00107FBEA9|nr:hypothetical protein [Desulfosporosinus sp. Sb-LF]